MNIFNYVLAAIISDNEITIYDYIEQKLISKEPSQIARGVLVAGCLDENSISEKIFYKYKDYHGIIKDAYKASIYMYNRNKWARHWFKQMLSAQDHENFWRYMILFTKVVDSRYYKWKISLLNESILYRKFYHSFKNDIENRCQKWQTERAKKLFGMEPPNPIYIYSQNQLSNN